MADAAAVAAAAARRRQRRWQRQRRRQRLQGQQQRLQLRRQRRQQQRLRWRRWRQRRTTARLLSQPHADAIRQPHADATSESAGLLSCRLYATCTTAGESVGLLSRRLDATCTSPLVETTEVILLGAKCRANTRVASVSRAQRACEEHHTCFDAGDHASLMIRLCIKPYDEAASLLSSPPASHASIAAVVSLLTRARTQCAPIHAMNIRAPCSCPARDNP